MEAKVEVIRINETTITVKDRGSTWWLGDGKEFNLPKDEILMNAQPGDIVTISLKEQK